jgi:hypothetical protein
MSDDEEPTWRLQFSINILPLSVAMAVLTIVDMIITEKIALKVIFGFDSVLIYSVPIFDFMETTACIS